MNGKKGKKILLAIVIIIGLVVVAGSVYWLSMPKEQRNMILFMMTGGEKYDGYQNYQVIDRNDEAMAPTSFAPSVANSIEGATTGSVLAITEMMKNENSTMAKIGRAQTVGVDEYTGWHVIADEGAKEGEYPLGPSPLSYYTSGLAANLHTQILKAAEVKGISLDLVQVEVMNSFRWNEMLSPDGAGFLDETNTNIIIESSASEKDIQEIKDMALASWTAGEALRNETVIQPSLVVNGNHWVNYRAVPGTTLSEVSTVDGLMVSSVSEAPKQPKYLVPAVKEEMGLTLDFNALSNMEFEIFAISESAGNSERPYLKKITVSTPTSETWEIYSDEFMQDNDSPLAPTSLEYFTVGTALCLTSQTTLVSAMLGLEFTDYRVENQIDYRQEGIDSTEMVGYTDTVHSYILIESEESQERLNTFFTKSLSLCFAGEGLKNETAMNTALYLNGSKIQ
jgi:uncharacterized OsmC-like protein